MVSSSGTTRFCAIWNKAADQTPPASQTFLGLEAEYGGDRGLQVDVQISKAAPTPSSKERYAKQLQESEKLLQGKPDDGNTRLQRALAYFHLGGNEKALDDLSWLTKKFPQYATGYQYRAFVQARLGRGKEAKDDLARFTELSSDPRSRAYTEAVVATYLGEDEQAMKQLEKAIADNARQEGLLYDAARAYTIASVAVATKSSSRAKSYADRAMALLQQAISQGYTNCLQMESDSDLDPIRRQPGYAEILKGVALDRRYTAVWHESTVCSSVELHGLGPAEHFASCQSLLAQGSRPASLSVMEMAGGAKLTASVWHRPVVGEADKERLGKRQANAAVALLKLKQPEKVWPLLKHSPDPRIRSYLIHRLSPLGADAGAIVKRLDAEPDITIRRALLLSLGEYSDKQLPSAARQALLPKLQDIYRTNSDAGLHAAVEWFLRNWKQEAWLKQVNDEWAKNKEQRKTRLESIRQLVGSDKEKSPPQWYVNSQGQTMVVIPGPVEFRMGSPLTEADREDNETPHKKRVGRTFALAAAPVTKEQFLKFQPGFLHSEFRRYPTPSCPIGGVSWYEAAAYCNWLSQQEGIDEEQWCYEFKNGKVHKLKANYLSLTGYRLPTEAEMEYATRAGALTSRYYGETDELLPKYAWYAKNAQVKTWPVGSLKPNDFGLFDVQGNVFTWCQERFKDYLPSRGGIIEDKEDTNNININEGRVLRGGSFSALALTVRSACRSSVGPATRYLDGGFRPARTYR
jgi:formylglycine-generating enzyme required for sulfatase activity/tetratricopeptide (TPR) repeat protein